MSSKKEKFLAKEGLLDPDLVFDIDKNLLDEEWVNQPKLYFRWASQLEDAKEELDEAKRNYDVQKTEFDLTKAEVEMSIRNDPDDYGMPKVTDKSIAAAIIMQPEYKEAQEQLVEAQKTIDLARHRVGILQAAVTALDHKKKALEKLVDLHGQKYFATPRASANSAEEMKEIEKQLIRNKSKKSGMKKKKKSRN